MAQKQLKTIFLSSCHPLPGAAPTAVLIWEKTKTHHPHNCAVHLLTGSRRQMSATRVAHMFTELCVLRLLIETAQKNVTTQECRSFCLWAKARSILRACLPQKCPGRRCGCCPSEGRRTGITDAGWSSSPTQTDPPEHKNRPSFFWL